MGTLGAQFVLAAGLVFAPLWLAEAQDVNPAVLAGDTATICLRVAAFEPPPDNPQGLPTEVAPISWFCDGAQVPSFIETSDGTLLDLRANPIGRALGVPHAAGHGSLVLRFNDAQGQPDPTTTVVWAWGGMYFDGTDRQRLGAAGSSQANTVWDCSVNPPPDFNCNQ